MYNESREYQSDSAGLKVFGGRVSSLPRSDSQGVLSNPNVDWLHTPSFWVWYLCLLVATRFLIGVLLRLFLHVSSEKAFTVVHLVHALFTFKFFHWDKGTPWDAGGKYDSLTFWEQIDHGKQYTQARKILTLIPAVLFLCAAYNCDWNPGLLVLNFAALSMELIGKFDFMHGVRIGGINRD
eukprot:gb/GEZN01021970.1/.p1 GENE.gb/GEZN01021970.1/~~gb/GEZN01021970.1/.p1  ORF type:complete len:181 (+),score=22.31 gb/GEZN01021970.1/:72-614(+)